MVCLSAQIGKENVLIMLTHNQVPKHELEHRLAALRQTLSDKDPSWDMVLIHSKINLYYLTGTMQDGVLVITPESAVFWVRRYLPRAQEESLFENLRPMKSFRVLQENYPLPKNAYIECKTASVEWLGMVRKYFPLDSYQNISPVLADLRAHKSAYELDCMRRAGVIHEEVLERIAPTLLHAGVSEAVLCSDVHRAFLSRGAMGISRFNQMHGEDVLGICSFSENGLRIGAFDGPDGIAGTCLAMPSIGNNNRLLRSGDLVLLDIPSGIDGYHTDKSVVFFYGDLDQHPAAEKIRRAYDFCTRFEQTVAEKMVAGAIPEEIFTSLWETVPEEFAEGFMNGGKFLGHSIGLVMDEPPVLARGFKTPLTPYMTFAVEPKIALPGVGLVGTENTYEITPSGAARSLTGHILDLTCIKN